MSLFSKQNAKLQSSSHYWGYREINASELQDISGGCDGGTNGECGGCSGSNYSGTDSQVPALQSAAGANISAYSWDGSN